MHFEVWGVLILLMAADRLGGWLSRAAAFASDDAGILLDPSQISC